VIKYLISQGEARKSIQQETLAPAISIKPPPPPMWMLSTAHRSTRHMLLKDSQK